MVFIILLLLITLLKPDVNFFNNGEYKFAQSISNLIPRTDRDNPVDDFETAVSYAMKSQIGVVVTNDPKRSISKESVSKLLLSSGRVGEVNNVEVDDVVLGKTFDGLADRVGSAVSVTTSAGSMILVNFPLSAYMITKEHSKMEQIMFLEHIMV